MDIVNEKRTEVYKSEEEECLDHSQTLCKQVRTPYLYITGINLLKLHVMTCFRIRAMEN